VICVYLYRVIRSIYKGGDLSCACVCVCLCIGDGGVVMWGWEDERQSEGMLTAAIKHAMNI
jgi:hypothetical protein